MKGLFIAVLLHFFLLQGCESRSLQPDADQAKNKNTVKDLKEKEPDMSNPILMMGSDLANLMKSYRKTGNRNGFKDFVHSSVFVRYEDSQINNWYDNLDLGYEMKPVSIQNNGDTLFINYECTLMATNYIKTLRVLVENDTAKICPTELRLTFFEN
jgi:hypothetical protein